MNQRVPQGVDSGSETMWAPFGKVIAFEELHGGGG